MAVDLALSLDDFDLLLTGIGFVEFLCVFWRHEVIVLTHNEKSWNKGFLHIFQRIQNGNVKVMLNYLTVTSFLIVLEIIDRAGDTKNDGTLGYLVATNSLDKSSRLLNGESRTSPAIDGSRSAYISAVTAPMLLPHSPIVDTFFEALR